MSNWLKTDAEDGMLIGPDECHYANEHQAAHYGLLHLCGCGNPEEAYNFCREVLIAFDRRKNLADDKRPWINAEDAVKEIIVKQPDVAAHVIAHLLSHLDLLEHGGSVGGSWLTDDGARIVDMGPVTEETMDQEYPEESRAHGQRQPIP